MYQLHDIDIPDNNAPWMIPLQERLDAFRQAKQAGKQCILALYMQPDYSTFRYRIYNIAQALQNSETRRMFYFFDRELESVLPIVRESSMLLLCRFRWTVLLHQAILAAKDARIPVVYDVDDYVFDPCAMPLLATSIHAHFESVKDFDFWNAATGRNYMTAEFADAFLSTNPYIGRLLEQKFHKRFFSIDNSLNQEQLQISEELRKKRKHAPRDSFFTLGYFSGSVSHFNDFMILVPDLIRLFEQYSDINLMIVGHLELPKELTPFMESGRILMVPFTDFLTLQKLMAQTDLNLVPLAENSFTNCKSELKFFESAVVDVPTCASPIYSYAHAIVHGRTGFLCRPGEWFETISRLYEHPNQLVEIAREARNYVLGRYAGEAFLMQLENAYDNLRNAYEQKELSAPGTEAHPLSKIDLLGKAYAEQDSLMRDKAHSEERMADTMIQCYFRDLQSAFSEGRMFCHCIQSGTESSVQFSLSTKNAHQIRIDAGEMGQMVTILHVKLLFEDGTVIDGYQNCIAGTCGVLPLSQNRVQPRVFLVQTDDPQFHSGEFAKKITAVEIQLCVEKSDKIAAELQKIVQSYHDITGSICWKLIKPGYFFLNKAKKTVRKLLAAGCPVSVKRLVKLSLCKEKINCGTQTLNFYQWSGKILLYKGGNALHYLFHHSPGAFLRKTRDMLKNELNPENATGSSFHAEFRAHYEDDSDFSTETTDLKTLAFYLPQYHTFPENDAWWGKGFTEWSNTRKALPAVEGHYQPREPHESIGYYDLADWRVLQKQADLARKHGIYGFCFYHYWFSGKRLMEKPVDQLLAHPEINLPFCLCWANENWTRAWDGKKNEILIQQSHIDNDIQLIIDLEKYIRDPRYIRVDGKPFVLVYCPSSLPSPAKTLKLWKKWAVEHGFPGLYIGVVRGHTNDAGSVYVEGADAEIEFPPAYCAEHTTRYTLPLTGATFLDYHKLVDDLVHGRGCVENFSHQVFRGCMLGWDCTARRKQFCAWTDFSIDDYSRWLRYNITYTRAHTAPDRRFLFINAWNEWAEGTYLEPDQRFGYVYLNATSRAIFNQPEPNTSEVFLKSEALRRKLFDADWYLKKYPELIIRKDFALEHFWNFGWRERRQPSAAFPSLLYLLSNPHLQQWQKNPLADYLSSGRKPEDLDQMVRIFDERHTEIRNRMNIQNLLLNHDAISAGNPVPHRIGVHVHLYYADMLEKIIAYLKNIPEQFDLFLSIMKGTEIESIRTNLAKRLPDMRHCTIKQVENRGRDIAPMICTFGKDLLNYDFICHIHTKKSLYAKSHKNWADFIYSHLLGSPETIQCILTQLANEAVLVTPPDFLSMDDMPDGWGSDLDATEAILKKAGLEYNLKKDFPIIEFSQGSMFWGRRDYLKPLLSLKLDYSDFPTEPIGTDGTIAHALERTLFLWDPCFRHKIIRLFTDEEDLANYSLKRYVYQKEKQ